MSGGAAGGGGAACGGRALRLLLLAVVALAAVEYMFGSILDNGTGGLRAYLSAPAAERAPSEAPPHPRTAKFGFPWPKRTKSRPTSSASPDYQQANASLAPNGTGSALGAANSSVGTVDSEVSNLLVVKIKENLETNISGENSEKSNETQARVKLKPCPASPPDLGPIPVNKADMSLEAVELKYPEVRAGGRHAPADCAALHKVAIIVPFRDREQHLAIFLNHMHPVLMAQKLDYGIFIIEQQGDHAFNRAKLMNVGYVESQKSRPGGWDCFVFHDIDLLPLDTRNLYSCPRQPRHMSVAIDKYHYNLPYSDIFGGVSALTAAQFQSVNGFSNKYWGWGGEDDDMFYRLKKRNYHVARYPMSIARYTMLEHKSQSPNPKRYQLLSQTNKVFTKDGLSSLRYEVVRTARRRLHTAVLVNIDARS